MKNIRKKILAVSLIFGLAGRATSQAVVSVPLLEAIQQSSFVQQISQYLTAIDTLYANYDVVANTIKNIENQYKQIQHAVEKAKSIDWENVRFDGDFDIRNDIRDANKRVNKLLNQARAIENSLTANIINIPGGASYSLADLCGQGADESKDVFTAAADVLGFMNKNMKDAAKAATEGITDEQGAAIMAKYGISSTNYWFVRQTENRLNTAISNAIAHMEAATSEMTEELSEAEETNAIVEAAMETLDSDGNMTEGAGLMGCMLMLRQLSQQLSSLKTATREATGLAAYKNMEELQKEEAKASAKQQQKKIDDYVDGGVPENFIKNPKDISD